MSLYANLRTLGWVSVLLAIFFACFHEEWARAADAQQWKAHTLSTAEPAARPLGCRTEHSEKACKPDVDSSALPALEKGVAQNRNPYRGQQDEQIMAIGHALFNQTCAYCHGADAVGRDTVGPDLRRFGGLCRRIVDQDVRAKCTADADAHFMEMVLGGRTILGIPQMPSWAGSLTESEIWSLQIYLESEPYTN